MTRQRYRVRTACEVMGIWRRAGEEIVLTAAQAAELMSPFGNVVEPVVLVEPTAQTSAGDPLPGESPRIARKRVRDRG